MFVMDSCNSICLRVCSGFDQN